MISSKEALVNFFSTRTSPVAASDTVNDLHAWVPLMLSSQLRLPSFGLISNSPKILLFSQYDLTSSKMYSCSTIPLPKMMSNSYFLNGGASLFFFTVMMTWMPMMSPALSLTCVPDVSRMRTEAWWGMALPPGVVCGSPWVTPMASRSWLIHRNVAWVWPMTPVTFRMARLMMRAWRPTVLSSYSPSSSAFGDEAATESQM